jgi:glycosyltransferase involved in cell wall biosynthesis
VRVLHITSTFPKAAGEATGPFLADLVAACRHAGIEVRVVAPHAPGVTPMEGVRRFRYGPTGTEVLAYRGGLLAAARGRGAVMVPPYVAAMAGVAAAEARAWRPDVVHAHWWFPGGLAAIVATRRPVIVTLHGSDLAFAHRAGLRPVARWVARRAAAVTAVSGALAEEASAFLGVPVTVSAMPVEVTPHVSTLPRSGLVAVGRLMPEKGFDVLLDALRIAPAPLTLVGSGPLEGELRARASGLDVRFAGAVGRAELVSLLAGSAALVVPSRREGLGLVAVEAIILGTPVIASAVGGLPEALGAFDGVPPAFGEVLDVPGGLLVPAGHVGALAAAIERVPELGPPGPLALAGAERHRPAAVGEHHLALYRSVAEGSAGGR